MGKIDESYNLQSPLKVKIEWCRHTDTPPLTLSISALLLNKDNLVDKLEDFVFYGTPSNDGKEISTKDGGVKCDSLDFKKGFGTGADYHMTIDLNKINPNISKVRIIASIVSKNETDGNIPGFDNLIKACFSITDGAGKVYSCDLERETESMSRSVDVAIVQRWDKNWRFVEELIFHSGGLDIIYDDDSYVSEHVSNKNPFFEIGNLFEIEHSYERQITVKRDGKVGSFSRVDKFIEKITGRYKRPTKSKDPFFEEKIDIKTPNLIISENTEREKFDFGTIKKNPSVEPDFSFEGKDTKKKGKTRGADEDFDFEKKQ